MLFTSKVLIAAVISQSAALSFAQELVADDATLTAGCAKDRCVLWSSKVISPVAGHTGATVTTDALFDLIPFTEDTEKEVLCHVCLKPPSGTLAKSATTTEVTGILNDMNCKGSTGTGIPIITTTVTAANGALGKEIPVTQGFPKYKLMSSLFWSEDSTKSLSGDDYYCVKTFENFYDPCCLESVAPSAKPSTAMPSNPPTFLPTRGPTSAPTTSMPTNPPTTGAPTSKMPTTAAPSDPCFSSAATIEVQGRGQVSMQDLAVGDVVSTPSGFEKVYTIDHRNENKLTEFVQIYSDLDAPLEVTSQHMIFLQGKIDPVEAGTIVVGDVLQAMIDGKIASAVVDDVKSISRNGLYNPITSSGTIIVDGVSTSTYTAISVTDGSNYLTVGGFKVISMHDFIHMAMGPFRSFCLNAPISVSDSICNISEGEEHNLYNKLGLEVMHFGKNQNSFVQSVIVVSLVSMFAAFAVMTNPLVLSASIYFFKSSHLKKNL